MSLPNFLCLGAAKSGTTTLFDVLRQHPDVYIPAFKEPHFFDIPENYNNGIEWYEKNYFRKADKRIIADFTPSYFFEKETPKRIFKDIGSEIKFVVLLRNPVDRAYSHYLHSVRDNHENLSFEESLKQENERLDRHEKNSDYLSYLRNSYFHQGLYGDMLERYLEYFTLDNFLFINFEEEFLQERKATIQKILEFLSIEVKVELQTNLRSNPASKERLKFLKKLMKKKGWWRKVLKLLVPSIQLRQIIKNRIQRANIKEYKKEELPKELKSRLYNTYFKENMRKFEQLTNKKLTWQA